MADFVAYHSVHVMGGDFAAGKVFEFESRRPESTLRAAIGARVWVVVGEREGRRTRYALAGFYTPEALRGSSDAWLISGKGVVLEPRRDLTTAPWLAELLAEQANFSLGFNRIRNAAIVECLQDLVDALPAPEIYASAFSKIRSLMSEAQQQMLRAHFLAPGHQLTARQLSRAAGRTGHEFANAQYGRLGTLLREASPEIAALEGQQSAAFASFVRGDDGEEWTWTMHGPAAEALSGLEWFADQSDSSARESENGRIAATEGALYRGERWHRRREPWLREKKIAEARAAHPDGRLQCQVPGCGFDFERTYGDAGSGFAEVHHIRRLADLTPNTETTLADLIVICSNCHSIVHRGGKCRSIDSLIRARDALKHER